MHTATQRCVQRNGTGYYAGRVSATNEKVIEQQVTRSISMGYHTEFRGTLHFTTKLTDPQRATIEQILGEDCREHPEWDATNLTRIDLALLLYGNGISWDGSECTTDMPEKVNVVIREMRKQFPDFGLEGTMLAQGSQIGDIWELSIGDDGFAKKEQLVICRKENAVFRFVV